MSALEVGAVIAERTVHLSRESLVRYAAASGDFNPIHYRDDVAERMGLPGVLAHGMLTMGLAASVALSALDGKAAITSYGVRFSKPIVVDADAGADVHVIAKVAATDGSTSRIDLAVTCGEDTVLLKAQLTLAHG